MYRRFVKRFLDIILASLALLVLSPILLLAAFLVKVTSKGPVFFTQERLGYRGGVFKILKFRSMTAKERKVDREILKGDPEVTRVGSILRRSKIDELPQLINILKGDMSVVGPRPCMPALQEEFNEDAAKRLRVRPGLTGMAQINGNIYNSWPERWKFDRYYVEHMSLWLDLRIIFKTFLIVLLGEDKFVKSTDEL